MLLDLYDQTGDINWVKLQQQSQNVRWTGSLNVTAITMAGEMMTDNHTLDWIDIILGFCTNAFVNAKLLSCVNTVGRYRKAIGEMRQRKILPAVCRKVKTSFNKSTAVGGFWDEQHGCYIHWRDKDGSIHGTKWLHR